MEFPSLSLSSSMSAVDRLMEEFQSSPVADRLAAVHESASDASSFLSLVLPVLFEVQGHVMSEFGFSASDEGFEAFGQQLERHEIDEKFKQKSDQLKALMKKLTTAEFKQQDEEEEDDEEEDEQERE